MADLKYAIMRTYDDEKLKRAKKRVEEMKGFYVHFVVYLAVNIFILVNIFIHKLDDGESFWQWGHFFTAIFWGLGVLFHAAHVFNLFPFFGKKWEERQIQKYIEKDKREAEKYR